ncbi:MAG: hypothetical protein ACRDK9_00835 [Solirubrobacterales bacterium]
MAAGGRPIDLPLESLPPIDEHAVEIAAPATDAWEALVDVVGGAFSSPASVALARALGCAETETAGDLRHPGGTVPGFVVARVIPPVLLALLGAHRFSRYALVFRIDDLGEDRSRLGAETRAEFPGVRGRIYRTLVIGTRGHVLVVNRLLRGVRRRAERA